MDNKRWVLAAVVVAVVITVLEAIFHGSVLSNEYAATAALWRPQDAMTKMMPYGWFTTLIISFILVYIYHRGYEGQGSKLSEGLRFGFIMGVFTALPMAVWTYIMLPVTLTIALGWFAIGMIDLVIAGIIIAMLYKRNA